MQTMTFRRRYIFKLAVPLLAAALMAAPASAAPGKSKSKVDFGQAYQQTFTPQFVNDFPLWAQAKVSAGQAKSIARRKHPGAKFNNISREGNYWVVRLVKKDGRIVDVFIDATTGRVR